MYSRKPLPLLPCVEECLPASLSNRLLASRLSPSSSVGGTLRGLAPEGRIYQSEQFYISANTTEEDLHGLNLVCMGIKIPCKSHWRRAGLDAGYELTLFQKVFYRYPFILPSSYAPPVTIAPQKYNEFPNHAINVNSVLTFGKWQNLRKIAAKKNITINNSLKLRTLKEYTKWNICQWNIIGDFYCLPP